MGGPPPGDDSVPTGRQGARQAGMVNMMIILVRALFERYLKTPWIELEHCRLRLAPFLASCWKFGLRCRLRSGLRFGLRIGLEVWLEFCLHLA